MAWSMATWFQAVPVGVEAHGAAVDQGFRVQRRRAMHLAAKTKFGVFIGPDDAGARLAQRGENLLGVVADRGNNANACDDDAPHDLTPVPGAYLSGAFHCDDPAAG